MRRRQVAACHTTAVVAVAPATRNEQARTVMFSHDRDADEPEIYHLRERIFDIGDDYWIETDRGRRTYKVDGKVLRVRDTFVIEDPSGQEVAHMQARAISIRDTFKIERPASRTPP